MAKKQEGNCIEQVKFPAYWWLPYWLSRIYMGKDDSSESSPMYGEKYAREPPTLSEPLQKQAPVAIHASRGERERGHILPSR
jgi:hypothetical protein